MRNQRRIAIIAGIVVIALIVFTVGATVFFASQPTGTVPQLSKVSYNQTKAVSGWDDATRTTTDPDQLTELQQLLHNAGWSPTSGGSDTHEGCVGGLATNLHLTFADGDTARLHLYLCGNGGDKLTTSVTQLISAWRTAATA